MRSTRVLSIGTPVFKNTGSTARDHLASERTFLAWMRTGLGFTALGIAVERFSQLDPSLNPAFSSSSSSAAAAAAAAAATPSNPHPEAHALHPPLHHRTIEEHAYQKEKEHLLVAALLGIGFGSIVYSVTRYFRNMRLLETGLFKPSYFGAAGLSVAVAGLAGGAYASALGERIKGREKEKEMERRRREFHTHGWERR